MNAALKKQLLEVIGRLNETMDHGDSELHEDLALNILEDYRDDIRQELKDEVAEL